MLLFTRTALTHAEAGGTAWLGRETSRRALKTLLFLQALNLGATVGSASTSETKSVRSISFHRRKDSESKTCCSRSLFDIVCLLSSRPRMMQNPHSCSTRQKTPASIFLYFYCRIKVQNVVVLFLNLLKVQSVHIGCPNMINTKSKLRLGWILLHLIIDVESSRCAIRNVTFNF